MFESCSRIIFLFFSFFFHQYRGSSMRSERIDGGRHFIANWFLKWSMRPVSLSLFCDYFNISWHYNCLVSLETRSALTVWFKWWYQHNIQSECTQSHSSSNKYVTRFTDVVNRMIIFCNVSLFLISFVTDPPSLSAATLKARRILNECRAFNGNATNQPKGNRSYFKWIKLF